MGVPVLLSVNATSRRVFPEVGDAENAAIRKFRLEVTI